MPGARSIAVAAALLASAALSSTSPPAASAAAPPGFFGIASWETRFPSAAEFQRLSAGGVGTARMFFVWQWIEPRPGVYDWRRYDTLVRESAVYGVRILPYLFSTPGFYAARAENPPLNSAYARAGWRHFVKAVVARYGRNGSFWRANRLVPYTPITSWEVWNEESSPRFWYRRVNPRSYVRLLRIAHTAAREADPKAEIVVGGLFPWPRAKGAVALSDYLPALYDVPGAKRWFEGVAVHPYTPNWRWTRRVMTTVRGIMRHKQDAHSHTWITEFGWSSGGPNSAYTRTPDGQASQLRHVYRMLLNHREEWNLRSASWFVWGDRARRPGEADFWGFHTGLFDVNGVAKPAWNAYAELAGGRP